MNIGEEITKYHNKENTVAIVSYIGEDTVRFEELLNIFTGDDYRMVQRSSWIVNAVAEVQPKMVLKYLPLIISQLHQPKHDAVKRNVLRLLQFTSIPKSYRGELVDICFNTLNSAKEPVAIKVFAMTVLEKITRDIPELQKELTIILEDQLPYGSAGFQSRAKKILKKINHNQL